MSYIQQQQQGMIPAGVLKKDIGLDIGPSYPVVVEKQSEGRNHQLCRKNNS